MLKHYFLSAWRNIIKYRNQSLICILGLAVGLVCFCLCLYFFRFIENTDKEVPRYEHISEVILHNVKDGFDFSGTPAFAANELREKQIAAAQAITTVTFCEKRNLAIPTEKQRRLPYVLNTVETDTAFFSVFNYPFIYGDKLSLSQPNSIILTRSAAVRLFGNTNPVGTKIYSTQRLYTSPDTTPEEGGVAYTIQGVTEDLPLNCSISFLRPLDIIIVNDSEGLFSNKELQSAQTGCNTYMLLHPSVSRETINEQMKGYIFPFAGEKNYTVRLKPMGKEYIHNSAFFTLGWFIFVIGWLILLSAALNFFTFISGSFYNRIKEYSIRKEIGSRNNHLFFLLFTEIFLMIIFTLVVAFCITELLSPYLTFEFMGALFTFPTRILFVDLLTTQSIIMLISLLICAGITIRLNKINLQTGLYGGKAGNNKHWIRNFMLGIQFFICILFITGSIALQLQANKISHTLFNTLTDKEKECIFEIKANYPQLKGMHATLINEITKNGNITETLCSESSLFSSTYTGIKLENADRHLEAQLIQVAGNFFSFFHIPLQGNIYLKENQIVITQSSARKMENKVIGQSLHRYNDILEVCGVSEDINTQAYNQYDFFLITQNKRTGYLYVKCLKGKEKETAQYLADIMKKFLPSSIRPEINSLNSKIKQHQMVETQIYKVLSFFAVVSLIITLLGILSTITLDTERRKKEVAIRKINGANIGTIITLFCRFYLIVLITATLFAYPILFIGINQWLQGYTVRFNYNSLFWISIFVLFALLTFTTIIFHILRIARTNPAEVIKSE